MLDVWVCPVIVLVAFSLHIFSEREEGEQQLGNPLIAKALDLTAERNLLLTPPLPFFSQQPYKGEMLLPYPSQQEQSPKWSMLSPSAHYRYQKGRAATDPQQDPGFSLPRQSRVFRQEPGVTWVTSIREISSAPAASSSALYAPQFPTTHCSTVSQLTFVHSSLVPQKKPQQRQRK